MKNRTYVALLVLSLVGLLLVGCANRQPADEGTPAVEASEALETTEQAGGEETSDLPETETVEPVETTSDGEIVGYANGRPAFQESFEAAKVSILSQFAQMYSQFGIDVSTFLQGAEGRVFELNMESEALRRVFATLLVEEEADRREITQTEEAVETEFETQLAAILAAQGWSEQELAATLESQNSTLESFKENGRRAVLWELTLDAVTRAIAGTIEATNEELAAYFEEHKSEYVTEEEVRASHILLGASDEDLQAYLDAHSGEFSVDEQMPALDDVREELLAAIREDAEAIREQLLASADFAELARENSTGPTGPNGGDLGWFGRGRMVAPFDEAAFALDVGGISEIVVTQFGFHIILVTDHRDAFSPVLEDVIDAVREAFIQQKHSAALEAWLGEAYEGAELEILLPTLDAMWAQAENVDLAISKLEALRDEGVADEPYLQYIIASVYESKLIDAQTERTALESEEDSEERSARMEELDLQIAEHLSRALAEYILAQESIGSDPSILEKINDLQAQIEPSTETDEPAEVTP